LKRIKFYIFIKDMKKIGIVGGLSPESTILYYKHIADEYYKMKHDYNFPEVIIYSISFGKFVYYQKNGMKKEAIKEILNALISLKNAGADFAIISANTPHIYFKEIEKTSPLPLISIISSTLKKAKEYKLQKILLLGTLFTMKSGIFEREFENDIEIIVPKEDEMEIINKIIFEELSNGNVRNESKEKIIKIIKSYDIDGVILGCTELPLLISQRDLKIKVLDTARIHAEDALNHAIS